MTFSSMRPLACPSSLFISLATARPFVGLEYVAEAQNEGPELFELLLVRNVVYAVNHRTPNGTAVHFVMSAEFGDLFVGQQHELFDELVGLLCSLK